MRADTLSQQTRHILFRCDATLQTGLGHLSRCLALGEALEELAFTPVYCGDYSLPAKSMLDHTNFKYIDYYGWDSAKWFQTLEALDDISVSAVVLDSYAVDDEFLSACHKHFCSTFIIDDFCKLDSYECSGILNFTVEAKSYTYPQDVKLMLGPDFFLVRKPYWTRRDKHLTSRKQVRNILIACGGFDRSNMTQRLLMPLSHRKDLNIHVIVSNAQEHKDEIKNVLKTTGNDSELKTQLPHLADEFSWADIILAGGGLTKYEAAYMGVPSYVVSQTVDEWSETKSFSALGLCYDAGRSDLLSDEDLQNSLDIFLKAHDTHRLISKTCSRFFSTNPTRNAANEIAKSIQRSNDGLSCNGLGHLE